MNKCIIWSNSCLGREYKVKNTSAMKCAKEFGRCEGGEVVQVISPSGKVLSVVRWTQSEGGRYYRTEF